MQVNHSITGTHEHCLHDLNERSFSMSHLFLLSPRRAGGRGSGGRVEVFTGCPELCVDLCMGLLGREGTGAAGADAGAAGGGLFRGRGGGDERGSGGGEFAGRGGGDERGSGGLLDSGRGGGGAAAGSSGVTALGGGDGGLCCSAGGAVSSVNSAFFAGTFAAFVGSDGEFLAAAA